MTPKRVTIQVRRKKNRKRNGRRGRKTLKSYRQLFWVCPTFYIRGLLGSTKQAQN